MSGFPPRPLSREQQERPEKKKKKREMTKKKEKSEGIMLGPSYCRPLSESASNYTLRITYVSKFSEWNELDNVSLCHFATSSQPEKEEESKNSS